MKKPLLILQIRPEDAAADDELSAFVRAGELDEKDYQRVRIEKEGVPLVDLDDFSAVVVGGGPYSVSDETKPPEQIKFEKELRVLLDEIIDRDFPFLGACYGLGVLASHIGGKVSKEKYSEGVGAITVEINSDGREDHILNGLPRVFRAFGGHKEACQVVPPGATLLASSETCPVQLIRVKKNIYASQFHPELDSEGLKIRINTYKHAGYFPPEEADDLIAAAMKETVTVPEEIFRRFISKYSAKTQLKTAEV